MRQFIFLILFTIASSLIGQELKQTVRGSVIDADSETPLIGAVVSIINSDPLIGVATNLDGNFRLNDIPVGRVSFRISYLGYETQTIPNIEVKSGKESIVNIKMKESLIKIEEVVINASSNKGEAVNEMAMISSRSVSLEESKRFVGSFNDPSRVVSNFAGVSNSGDGSSDIIVRGNAPKYIQWRLEGMEITSPYHFNDANSSSGGLSTLNNNLLATSDFYTGAFSPEYGDALSGVFDVKLRSGNNEKFESTFGFGLLGTDFTVEGPLKKGYGGSYLVNYRYSTVGIISDLGLVDINGVPKFQDAAFKIQLPSKSLGTFSVFGLAGYSNLNLEEVSPDLWITPGDGITGKNLSEDFNKDAYQLNLGLNHTIAINENSYFKTTIAYSLEGIEDRVEETRTFQLNNNGSFYDSTGNKTTNFMSNLDQSNYRVNLKYKNKINARNSIQIGSRTAHTRFKNDQSILNDSRTSRTSLVDFDKGITSINNYVSWKYRYNEFLTLVSGVHNMNVLLTDESTIEPRIALNWKLNEKQSIEFGYGNHSTMESVHHYYTKIQNPDGSISEPNKDLGLIRANHFVMGYNRRINKNVRIKAELYYQDIYNIPVENNDTSIFATINEGIEYQYVDLVNKGTGENYGLELTLERFFSNNYYFLVNGTIFNSSYTALDGKERSTRFDGDFIFNALAGKEFTKLGKNKNKILAINSKIFYAGGKRIIPLQRGNDGKALNQLNYAKAYEESLDDLFSLDLSVSYKIEKPKATHELFLDLISITNYQGKIREYYDDREPDNIGYTTQFGAFPNLMYRVYF
jgi:hypothetical protein